MYVVAVWLDVFDLWNVARCDVVRCLDVKPCEVIMIDFLKALGLAFCVGAALVVGPLALQLHVQALEIKQAEQMIEAIQNTPPQFRNASPFDSWRQSEQINDNRISEYRPD
jgi:hypothetical protein